MLLRRSSTGRHRPRGSCARACQPTRRLDAVGFETVLMPKLTKQAQHPVAAPAPAPLFFCGCWT